MTYTLDAAGRPVIPGMLVYEPDEWAALDPKPKLPAALRSGHIAVVDPSYVAPVKAAPEPATGDEWTALRIAELADEEATEQARLDARPRPEVVPFALPVREAESVWDALDSRGALPWLIERFTCGGLVTLVSGPPKKGKSTMLAQLVADRRLGLAFLDRETLPGPTLLLSEEGEYPFTYRWRHSDPSGVVEKNGRRVFIPTRTPPLDVVFYADVASDPKANWRHYLEGIEAWVVESAERFPDQVPLVIIDTLLVWAGIEDENDSSGTTHAVAQVTGLAQRTGAAVIVVHHTRKGGGSGGEAIRGSSAIYATVDMSIEFRAPKEDSDDRKLHVTGRVVLPETVPLMFDRGQLRYSLGQDDAADDSAITELRELLAKLPDASVYSTEGFTQREAQEAWALTRTPASRKLDRMVEKGLLEAAPPTSRQGGSAHRWRATDTLSPEAKSDHGDDEN